MLKRVVESDIRCEGRIIMNKRSVLDDLSIIVIQLFSYSSFLLEKLDFELKLDNRKPTRLELYPDSEMSALDFRNQVEKVLGDEAELTGVRNAELTWYPELSKQKEQYRISFSYRKSKCSLSFFSSPESYFYPLLINAAGHFENISSIYFNQPGLPVSLYSFITENENEQIDQFSYGPAHDSEPQLLHSIFERTAHLFPKLPCIQYHNDTFNYSKVNETANQLAHFLGARGVVKGDVVGILMHRSPELYISMLAVLKAGAAYVPLDISFPAERLKFILEDSGAKCLLSQFSFNALYFGFSIEVFCIDNILKEEISDFPKGNTGLVISPVSPAYIIYTSGSTGFPKGVEISHTAISNLVESEKILYHISEKEKVAQTFSPAFDASVEEIWMSFSSGSCLYPVSETIMHSAEELAFFIIQRQITVLSTVPTMLSVMRPPLTSLRLLILGGEECPDELLNKWTTYGLRIINTYGPTEATVIATSDEHTPSKKITI